jgi:hypothetical protein
MLRSKFLPDFDTLFQANNRCTLAADPGLPDALLMQCKAERCE